MPRNRWQIPCQVHHGPLAAPGLDTAALLRSHPRHRHHDAGAALHPEGNARPKGSGERGIPAFRGPLRELCPRPPQFLHTGSPLREEITAEVYEDELDMRRSGSCLNSSIASAWSEHSLDPDDIRVGATLRTFF